MARDKRGHIQEPTVAEQLEDITAPDASNEAIAGPTSRNEIGNTKRAAAKAIGVMGASKKLDPDLKIPSDLGGQPKSGSKVGIHSFKEVPAKQGARVRRTVSNAEISEGLTTTARKSPAPRAAKTDTDTGFSDVKDRGAKRTGSGAQRIPAPGNVTDVPKGTLVRGRPTATQLGGRTQSSTGHEKPPKRAGRAGSTNRRPLSKGGSEER
jgi:hypothetical protein